MTEDWPGRGEISQTAAQARQDSEVRLAAARFTQTKLGEAAQATTEALSRPMARARQ